MKKRNFFKLSKNNIDGTKGNPGALGWKKIYYRNEKGRI